MLRSERPVTKRGIGVLLWAWDVGKSKYHTVALSPQDGSSWAPNRTAAQQRTERPCSTSSPPTDCARPRPEPPPIVAEQVDSYPQRALPGGAVGAYLPGRGAPV